VQIECLLRVIRCSQAQVNSLLDLGCGMELAKAIAAQYPEARGIALGCSEPMLAIAQKSVKNYPNVEFM
jgi:trans-aconitate methyltransferase